MKLEDETCAVSYEYLPFFIFPLTCFNIFWIILQDDEDVPVELRDSPEYKELMELKRIKKYKSSTDNEQVGRKVAFYVFLFQVLIKC